jgi:uncharacterized protein YcbK (DUF882 family)
MRVTEHFDSDEFKCHEGTPYPLDQADEDAPGGGTWLETRLRPLCETLETIRAQVGRPVTIDSGFRTVAYDQRLYDRSAHDGLVATPQGSQHPKGRAADIKVANVAPALLHRIILDLYKAGRLPHLGGIGLYPNFVHVDVRPRGPGNHLAQWGGERDSNIV